MNEYYAELPAVPIVTVLGLVLFAVLVARLHRRRILTVPRAAVAAAISLYAAGIVANTVFPIYLNAPERNGPWTPYATLIPFTDWQLDDALINVGVFVPLGVLIPLLLARPSWPKVIGVAAGVSLAIELSQFIAGAFFGGGHVTDINDFMFNVTGGVVGYAIFLLLLRIPGVEEFAARFRIPSSNATEAL